MSKSFRKYTRPTMDTKEVVATMKRYDVDDYDIPEGRQICDIYHIFDI